LKPLKFIQKKLLLVDPQGTYVRHVWEITRLE
jgi:hypothetical protein